MSPRPTMTGCTVFRTPTVSAHPVRRTRTTSAHARDLRSGTGARAVIALLIAAACGVAAAQSRDVMLSDAEVTVARIEELLGSLSRGAVPACLPERSRTIVLKGGTAPPRPPTARPGGAAIVFDTDSAELTPASRRSLDTIARAINGDTLGPLRFLIEGHADRRGRPDHNLRLSQARAEAVRNHLVREGRVDAARLEACGMGDLEPLNEAEIAAPENRRVAFVTRGLR